MNRRSSDCPGASGFTMIEMVIATTFLMLLMFLVTNMILSGNAGSKYASRLGRVTEITQQITDEIKTDVSETVRIFGNDALGLAYRAVLQPWSGAIRLASSRLPTIRPLERFSKDTVASEKTGNELLFVRHAWADSFTCTSTNTYRVDIVRVVAYYMIAEGSGPSPDSPWGLNLVKWTSEPLIDSSHIDNIADPTDQAEVLVHLLTRTPDDNGQQHAAAEVVWNMNGDPAVVGTFRQVTPTGTLSDFPGPMRSPTWEIVRADELSTPGLLFYRHHSLASNYAQSNQGMSRFGLRNDAMNGVGFPHGLEVQVVGAPGARKVMLHMTTVSTNRNGMKAYYDTQLISNVRER